jgi:RNA polymerase sigma factor (sigma-70 family)
MFAGLPVSASSPSPPDSPKRLEDIRTDAIALRTREFFVERYRSAMRAYLRSMATTADDADEIFQDVMVRFLDRGFGSFDPARGRFRDYLKATLRNAVTSHRRQTTRAAEPADLNTVPADDSADDGWLDTWRACLLDRTWQRLAEYEKAHPGNAYYTVLRLQADHPRETSARLAERLSASVGRSVSAAAFRQHASRGRRLFARFLTDEVALTVEPMTLERVTEELAELKLLAYVQGNLPG